MIFEQNRQIHYSHLSKKKTVSRAEILRFFQDAAVAHTNESGYSLEKLYEMEKAWIMLSLHVRFEKDIPESTSVKIETWTYDFARVCGPRAYQVTDAVTGERFASASAMWTYIDTAKGRPCEIPEDMLAYFGDNKPSNVPYIRRAPNFNPINHITDFKVLKRDLDTNGHMNNVKYMEYAEEAIPDGVTIKEVEIFYKNQVFYGDILSLYAEKDEEGAILTVIKNQDDKICTYLKFIIE